LQIPIELAKEVHWNLSIEELIDHALIHGEGIIASNGALVAYTGKYTGRTPQDKFIVREPSMEAHIWWDKNRAMEPDLFKELQEKACASLPTKRLYVVDSYAGADPEHRIKVRFYVENAYHALFIRSLLIRPSAEELVGFEPDWVALNLSREKWVRTENNVERDAVIALNFGSREILIMGTEYAGEMKKSIFTVLNGILPLKGVMAMHCSANVGEDGGDVGLFFGLSGTGKTTLSANPRRPLIGDDEHGWDDKGVFNFEGGCYAKCIDLSQAKEPQIWAAIRRGSVLENVVLDDNLNPVYSDKSYTENTRCAYPLDFIAGAVEPSMGGHPENIVFLTCDANGVLPPISRLNREQMIHYFVNGYTAKVAGTEAGVTRPSPNFSTCFGAPFLPLRPTVYAELLAEKVAKHGSRVWLVNTGWTGGPYGVGTRIALPLTRAMVDAAFDGLLDHVEYRLDPIFELEVPVEVPGVPPDVLNPRETWQDKDAFDREAAELERQFEENYEALAGPWSAVKA
jgi:phosphoenolpyruvate carboxykinase (ATP)